MGSSRRPPELLRRLLRQSRPPYILLEGLDYAGKSTIARCLAARLEAEGHAVRINAGGLHRGYFRRVAWTARDRVGPDPLSFPRLYYLNLIYTAVALADPVGYRADDGKIVIQESYADRMVAYQRGHAVRVCPDVVAALRPLLVQFDVTILLTASLEAKRQRYLHREHKRDGTDLEVMTRPDELWRSEVELRRLVARRPNSHIVDSSELTVEETVERVWELVKPVLGRCGRTP